MKKYLLPEGGNFYKANLHCHSTLSDGKWTVEQLKERYMAHGYSVIAFTDHDAFFPHNDLTDEHFLALNGYEVGVSESEPSVGNSRKTCHLCFIAKDKNMDTQKIFYNSRYVTGEPAPKLDQDAEPFDRYYSPEGVNKLIKAGKDAGFYISYNHPVWSLEDKDQYCNYHGMDCLEIVNFASVVEGYYDHCQLQYDEMLRGGERIFCVGSDDNHNAHGETHALNDSFGGFTVIKAEELTYEAIIDALTKGNFYASEGPAIDELWIEDGKVHIKTSSAKRIVYSTGKRRFSSAVNADGSNVCEAEFTIRPDDVYFRITVYDNEGNAAYTNAYFLDELAD